MSGNIDIYNESYNYKILKYLIEKSNKYINGDYKNYPRKFWYLIEFDSKTIYDTILISKNHNDLLSFMKKNNESLYNINFPLENNKKYYGILNNDDLSKYDYYFKNKSESLFQFIKENIKNYNNKYLRLSNNEKENFKTFDIKKKK